MQALILALLLVTAPYDYAPTENLATVGVSHEQLSGTDMAITELGRQALPFCAYGIRVRFTDGLGNFSPIFDLTLALMAASGDIN